MIGGYLMISSKTSFANFTTLPHNLVHMTVLLRSAIANGTSRTLGTAEIESSDAEKCEGFHSESGRGAGQSQSYGSLPTVIGRTRKWQWRATAAPTHSGK